MSRPWFAATIRLPSPSNATGATCGSARPYSPSATQAASAVGRHHVLAASPFFSSVTAARATPLRSTTQPTTSPGTSPPTQVFFAVSVSIR